MKIPVNFEPRWYQQEALQALEGGQVKFAVWCWSRRGGKDFTGFGYAVKKMVEQPMNVVLVFPLKEQGKDAFWDNVENDGFKTIEHIPASLIKSKNNDDMKITLKNGSTFQVMGAGNPEKLRGANAKLYIFSEFVDIPKAAVDVIRPIVRNNGGQIIIQSTPKIDGISGATFQMWFERAAKNWASGKKTQYASRITAREYLDDATLEEIRQETIEENGNDFFYRQEYLCDWGQASSSSYYGHALQMLKDRDGIGYFPCDRRFPVYTVWDWGLSDNMAIGFFQIYLVHGKPQVRIIDAHEFNDIGIKQAVKFIKTKNYTYGWHFFPHDVKVRDSDLIERIEKFRDEGLINSSVLRREGVDDGIERVVKWLKRQVVFNDEPTSMLRRKLRIYKRKFNPKTGDYVGPMHDSASHSSDMVRYLFAAIEQEFDEKTCEHYYSQGGGLSPTYETEEFVTTAFYQPS